EQTLDRARFEVVVIDDGSADATAEILSASDVPDVVITHPVNLGLGAARNTGFVASRGRYVCFTDVDCEASASWLTSILAAFERWPDTAGIGGAVDPAYPTTVTEHWYAYAPGTAAAHQPLMASRSRLGRALRL